jgi:hypothetical protein
MDIFITGSDSTDRTHIGFGEYSVQKISNTNIRISGDINRGSRLAKIVLYEA